MQTYLFFMELEETEYYGIISQRIWLNLLYKGIRPLTRLMELGII